MNLYPDPIAPFRPADFQVKRAQRPHEILGHHRLRREAFCIEQRLFLHDDRDAVDGAAIPIVAISCLLGAPDEVMGTVRIHASEPGQWWGSRLCVTSHLRGAAHLGAELIRYAVSTATAEGCDRFLAHVQLQNLLLFKRLHWHERGRTTRHGLPHALMQADLAHYPPLALPTVRHLPPLASHPSAERRPDR